MVHPKDNPPEGQMVRRVCDVCVVRVVVSHISLSLPCVDPTVTYLASPHSLDRYVSGQGSGGVPTSNRLVSPLAAFQARGIDVTFEPGATVDAAVSAAKAADVAIIFGSAHSGEGESKRLLH